MAAQVYSSAYVDALRDERALLKEMQARGDYSPADAREMLANVEATMRQGYSGPMLDYMRGSRDFWRNQCAKLEAKA